MVDADDLPFVTGLDVAGVVSEVGDGVRGLEPGKRVVLCPNETCGSCRFCREGPENMCERFSLFHGGLAETASVQADRLVPLPEGMDATTAAAIPTAYMTAFHMLRRAEVGPGETSFSSPARRAASASPRSSLRTFSAQRRLGPPRRQRNSSGSANSVSITEFDRPISRRSGTRSRRSARRTR